MTEAPESVICTSNLASLHHASRSDCIAGIWYERRQPRRVALPPHFFQAGLAFCPTLKNWYESVLSDMWLQYKPHFVQLKLIFVCPKVTVL